MKRTKTISYPMKVNLDSIRTFATKALVCIIKNGKVTEREINVLARENGLAKGDNNSWHVGVPLNSLKGIERQLNKDNTSTMWLSGDYYDFLHIRGTQPRGKRVLTTQEVSQYYVILATSLGKMSLEEAKAELKQGLKEQLDAWDPKEIAPKRRSLRFPNPITPETNKFAEAATKKQGNKFAEAATKKQGNKFTEVATKKQGNKFAKVATKKQGNKFAKVATKVAPEEFPVLPPEEFPVLPPEEFPVLPPEEFPILPPEESVVFMIYRNQNYHGVYKTKRQAQKIAASLDGAVEVRVCKMNSCDYKIIWRNQDNNTKLIVYTDGSCVGNPGPGGWAVIGPNFELSGNHPETTNNRMEMTAIVEAVKYFNKSPYDEMEIVSDSQYSINTFSKWMYSWEKRSWKKNDGEIKNLDIIKEAFDLLKDNRDKVTFKKVKGHAGHPLNERADEVAKAEAEGRKLL